MSDPQRFTIAIALIALVVAALNLYVIHLRRARLQMHAGEWLHLQRRSDSGKLGITISVAVANHGARLGTVTRLALLLQLPRSDYYLLEPHEYQRMTAEGGFVTESAATPIDIAGRATVVTNVAFRAAADRADESMPSTAGVCHLLLLGWVDDSLTPEIGDRFDLEISREDIAALEQLRASSPTTTVAVQQTKRYQWWRPRLAEVAMADLPMK